MKQILTNKSGIYCIKNEVNNKKYIGSAKNIKKRRNVHKCRLRKNIHENPHLQASWNKYGESNFTWSIIEIMENAIDDALKQREKFYFDLLKPEYNIVNEPARNPFPERARERVREVGSREYVLYSPDGKEYDIKNLKKFCGEYNLVYRYMSATIRGKQGQHKGWTGKSKNKNYPKYEYYKRKVYRFKKNDQIFETNDLNKFEKDHGISKQSLLKLANNKVQKIKGFEYVK
jgi:group I intron endonuclease